VEDEYDQGSDEEEEAAVGKAAAELDHAANQAMRIAKRVDGSPLREATLNQTLSQISDGIAKLGGLQAVRYPKSTDTTVMQDHGDEVGEDEPVTTFPNRQNITTVPDVEPGRHHFDDLVDAVQRRDGGSRFAAMSTARQENPQDFLDYNRWTNSQATEEQHESRRDNEGLGKSAPNDYERALSAQIAKGFSPHVAAQRLANMGIMPSEDSIAKANEAYADLREAAQQIVDREGGSRTDALRKARLFVRPDSYRALQGRV
jgi:hypothetical protein